MKKILILSSLIPYPLIGGGRIRIYNIAKILSRNHKIDLLYLNEGRVESDYLERLKEVFNEVICFSYHPLRFKWNAFKGLFLKKPLQVSYYYFKEIQRWINERYRDYDLIFCNHIRTVEYIKNIACAKIVDLHDAISMNYARARLNAKGWWKVIYFIENKKLLPYEIKTIDEFDKSFIVSDIDRDYLVRNGAEREKIITVPVAVREEVVNRVFKAKEKYELVFLGKMDYPPNEDAVIYFTKAVFPILKKEKKKLKFIVVGARPTKRVLKLRKIEGVEVTGFVEDHCKYIEASKVFVAPIRFGAGIQNKILEAMALGKPVVTTSLGAEGIKGREGEHFLVADKPEEMVEKIMNLLENKNRRGSIGKRARALIEEKYTWKMIGEQFLKEIGEILKD